MQVCIPEKFIFQTIPVRCQTIQKTCHFTAFSVNRHKKQFPNLKSPLLHHLFGTRLVRRETYSFDRRSLHSFLREYSSELESFFKLYFFIYYNTLLKISHVIHSCTLCRHITQQQIFFLNCSILSEEIQGKELSSSVPVCLFTPNILNYTQTCHYIITGSTKRHISVL